MRNRPKSDEGILLEICCESVHDVLNAELGGADRVELCSALFLGGLTPSLGTLLQAKLQSKTGIPVMAMLRPRRGGFCYDQFDFDVMKRDAELLVQNGADGIVMGILLADANVDVERCGEILQIIRKEKKDTQTVFHRAFDLVLNPTRALEELIDLGFTRILTSGQRKTAVEGERLIRQLVDQAHGRIQILPGSGINRHNAVELLRTTGCRQVHATAWGDPAHDLSASKSAIRFGDETTPPETEYAVARRTVVQDLRDALASFSSGQAQPA